MLATSAAALFASVPLAAFAPQGPGAAARSLEVFPLQALCAQPRRLPLPPRFGTLLRGHYDEGHDLLHVAGAERQFTPEHAMSLVRLLHEAETESSAIVLDVKSDAMLVWADGTALAQLRAELKDVQAILARPLAIDAHLYSWEADEPPPAVLGPKELSQFQQGRTALWTGTAATRSNGPVRLGAGRTTPYVFDVNIEVAQKSSVANALIETFFEGLDLAVLPHAMTGSQDVVLQAQLAFGRRRGEVKTLRTGLPDQPSIDAPLLESMMGGFSGRVPSGGALLVSCSGHAGSGARFVLAVSPRFETPISNPVVGSLGLYPVSALTTNALDTRYAPPRTGEWDELQSTPEGTERFGRYDDDFLRQLLHDALGQAAESQRIVLSLAGGYLFARGAPEHLAAVEGALRALQDRAFQTVEVRAAVRLQEAEGDGVLAAARSGGAAAVLHAVVLPTLLGREATLVRTVETPILSRYESRIAAESKALDPQTTRHATGLWLSAVAAPAPETAVHGDLLLRLDHAPEVALRPVEPAAVHAFPEVASTTCTRSAESPSGKTVDLGTGPAVQVDGRTWRTTLQVTLTRL